MLCGIKGLRGSLSATNARTDGSTRLRTVSMQRTVPPSTTSAAARGRPARLVGVLVWSPPTNYGRKPPTRCSTSSATSRRRTGRMPPVPMRDIDRLLAKAQDLIDQAWRTAQTKREVIALVDAYHDVRRDRKSVV